jgi:large subunit ribosomal protein L19
MKRTKMMQEIEEEFIKKNLPPFNVGDTISVSMRIADGEKERIQVFSGTVISRKGSGASETISMYRISYGSSMERVFLIHSPKIAKIEVLKRGKVRKSKLYYLRGAFGKLAKVKETVGFTKDSEDKPPMTQTLGT